MYVALDALRNVTFTYLQFPLRWTTLIVCVLNCSFLLSTVTKFVVIDTVIMIP